MATSDLCNELNKDTELGPYFEPKCVPHPPATFVLGFLVARLNVRKNGNVTVCVCCYVAECALLC